MPVEIQVTITDTLQDCVDAAIEQAKTRLYAWLEENEWTEVDSYPCVSNDLDYDGSIHMAVDDNTPTGYSELRDLYYLYEDDFNTALENAGVYGEGDPLPDNIQAVRVFYYIEQELNEYLSDNLETLCDEWFEENKPDDWDEDDTDEEE